MSDSTVTVEQVKEITNKDKDEKKAKKKKAVKSAEGKSKSSSRKSSTVRPADDDESIATENDVQLTDGSTDQKESEAGISSNETPELKSKNETESPASEDGKKSDENNVIMLREMDFRKLAELREAFHLFDINRDGYIDKEDLKFTFTSMGKPEVADEALDQMLMEMSSDGVDFDAFVKVFGYKAIELDPEEELLAALSKWDYVGNGMISEETLKRDLQGWGDKFSEIEAERALEEAPVYKKEGTTMIDYVQFCHNICGLRNIEKTRQIEKEAEAYEKDLRSFVK